MNTQSAAISQSRRHLRLRAAIFAIVAVNLPSTARSNTSGVISELISMLTGGPQAEDARELANATVATTRSTRAVDEDKQEVALGGAIGSLAQTVGRGTPVRIAWHGGSPPFQVALTAMAGTASPRRTSTQTRMAVLDLSDAPAGPYHLQIDAANERHLTLRVNLVDDADIPKAPFPQVTGAEPAEENRKELLQAVWLLMRGGMKYHLDALSRLQTMVDVNGDPVAKLILTPDP